jgi:hypothetical protein
VTEEGASCFERHAPSEFKQPDMNDPDDIKRSFNEFMRKGGRGAYAGKRLSTVKKEDIANAIEIANECNVGASIDLLLRRAGLTAGATIVTAFKLFTTKDELGQPLLILHWTLALQDATVYRLATGAKRAMLFNKKAEKLASVTREEAIAHLDRLASLTPPPAACP